jgi:hypothetical protein
LIDLFIPCIFTPAITNKEFPKIRALSKTWWWFRLGINEITMYNKQQDITFLELLALWDS